MNVLFLFPSQRYIMSYVSFQRVTKAWRRGNARVKLLSTRGEKEKQITPATKIIGAANFYE